jgi:hypothetical protein
VVEQGVNVRELEVSVLGNDEPVASVVGEVRPRREFYDYVAKYVSDDSELIIPADLTAVQSDEVRRLAVKAYQAIDCAGLGRVDLLLDVDNGRLYLNEINTIPGFTRISMYPKLWAVYDRWRRPLLPELHPRRGGHVARHQPRRGRERAGRPPHLCRRPAGSGRPPWARWAASSPPASRCTGPNDVSIILREKPPLATWQEGRRGILDR